MQSRATHAAIPRYLPPQAAIKAAEKEDAARAKEETKKKVMALP